MLSTLRARLIAISVLILVLALLLLSAANFWTVRTSTMTAISERIDHLTAAHAERLGLWMDGKRQAALSVKNSLNAPDPIASLRTARLAGDFSEAFFVLADKRFFFTGTLPADYDGTQRGWYKQGAAAQGPELTEAYIDAVSNELTVSVVEPMRQNGQLIGVAGADVPLGAISKMLQTIRPYSTSFAILTEEDGHVLGYRDASAVMKPSTNIHPALTGEALQRLAQAPDGEYIDIHMDGKHYMVFAKPVPGTDWILAVTAPWDEATKAVGAVATSSVTTAVVSVIIATLVLIAFIRSQLVRLDQARAALHNIASGEGDLTLRLDAHGTDELAQIGQSFNRFADKITTVLRDIRTSADSVRMAATEIASGNQDLSNRTEAQAGSLEQTSSAMEQLTATVQQNADNAAQANNVGREAAQVATQANAAVQQVVSTMGAISQSSNKIKDIIGVIDGIAFQTNILALNAAVEAARAGEQGRGFAVVAAEVRSLAQRSATAAKEIKDLIDESVRQAETGSRLVDEAGAVMGQVVDRIGGVSTLVSEITNASREQSAGITEVGSAVTQMDQATQQNAALVEQAAAAAQSLQQQAATLAELVATFKLDAHGTSPHLPRLR